MAAPAHLASTNPVATVESYWPYATTLFDYIRRAMPFSGPGSLSNDEVYAVTAYVLAEGHIIDKTTVIDAETFQLQESGEAFLPDAGQRSRANIPGDDPGKSERPAAIPTGAASIPIVMYRR